MEENTIMRASTAFITHVFLTAIFLGGAYSVSAQHTKPVDKGPWGGAGVLMNVTEAGATIEFDCANASITEEMRVKHDGSFVAEGNFMRSGPGPVRVDDQGTPAIFKGKVSGKEMTLKISNAKTGDSLGEYSLTQGRQTRLHRCY